MKMKAIVTKLDTERGMMVVLTKDRQFKRLPVPDPLPRLGDTVDIDTKQGLPWFRLLKSRWVAAAVAVMVLVTGLFGYTQVSAASTYITLDMKSSLQVAVDGKGRVKSIRPLNKSGAELVQNLSLDKKDVYTAIEEIMRKAAQSGYFRMKQDNLVMAGVSKINRTAQYNLDLRKLRSVIYNEMSANHYPGYIVISDVNTLERGLNGKTELSANKQILLEKARQSGLTLKEDAAKDMDMMEIVKKCNSSVRQLFPENSYRVTWQDRMVETGGSGSKAGGQGGTPPVPDYPADTGGMHRDAGSGMPANNGGMGMPGLDASPKDQGSTGKTLEPSHMPGLIQDSEGRGMMQGMPR